MADIVRVLRIIEYVGPREAVEAQIEKSLHGTRRFREGPDAVAITATTLGEVAEILQRDSNPPMYWFPKEQEPSNGGANG